MNKAHCDYYTNFVNVNSVNQRRLFDASKSLLNISRSASLLLSADDHQLANNFGASFTKKKMPLFERYQWYHYQFHFF